MQYFNATKILNSKKLMFWKSAKNYIIISLKMKKKNLNDAVVCVIGGYLVRVSDVE